MTFPSTMHEIVWNWFEVKAFTLWRSTDERQLDGLEVVCVRYRMPQLYSFWALSSYAEFHIGRKKVLGFALHTLTNADGGDQEL